MGQATGAGIPGIATRGERRRLSTKGPSSSSETAGGSSRRNQFEIWAEVLEVCVRTGRTQSWLLRQLRLKTSAIKDALEFLLGAGLVGATVNADVDTRQYQTTPRGEESLTTYYKLITKYFLKEKKQ